MHHAELHVGDTHTALERISASDRTPGADVVYLQHERFSIAEARNLKDMAAQRPVERPERVFILIARSFTTDAQNALLKLLEEPPRTARFYIVVPREDVLIATLRSRLMRPGADTQEVTHDDAYQFMQQTYGERLAEVAARMKEKDEEWLERVLKGVEVICHDAGEYEALEEIRFVSTYMYAPGASKKMLMEHLALTLSVPK